MPGSAAARDRPRLVVYTKAGCHLCDDARRDLWSVARNAGVALTERDILTDAGLFAAFRWRVPVVEVDGREIAAGVLRAADLMRVAAALRRRAD